MKTSPLLPPEGTVRDWQDHRATEAGVAAVFPETGEELDWRELRDQARALATVLTSEGAEKTIASPFCTPMVARG